MKIFLVLIMICGMTLLGCGANIVRADYDPDGDPLEAVLRIPPMMGTVILNSDGSFTYTPKTDFVGIDSFMYVAREIRTDQQEPLVSNEATVAIQIVEQLNRPPVAIGDVYIGIKNTPLVIDAEHGVLRVYPENK